jgi:class 3 adenylate cyclase
MRGLFIFLLVLLSCRAYTQQGSVPVRVLTIDSLYTSGGRSLDHGWLFKEGDNPAMGDNGHDDGGWSVVNSRLDSLVSGRAFYKIKEASGKPYYNFSGVGWFRMHIEADTSITNMPLALTLTHYGASEIYLDGQRIKKYGIINGKDSSEYMNPTTVPVFFVLTSAGHHVIAVRYANYNANDNYRKYGELLRGFSASTSLANRYISTTDNLLGFTFFFIFLFGVFGALSMAHLFLYLYNRATLSNLYFSLFCLAFSLVFFLCWLTSVSTNPDFKLINVYMLPLVLSVFCFSLSGVVNNLFAKKKLRFIIITIMSVVSFVCICINQDIGIQCYIILQLLVVLEAIIMVIRAIFRKVPGARIIGMGVISFTLFVLFNLFYILISPEGLSFESGTTTATIFITLLTLALLSLPVSMSMFLAWNFANVNKELKRNLEQVETLSQKTIAQELEKIKMIETQKQQLEEEVVARTAEVVAQNDQLEKQHKELKTEKLKSDELLLNILPAEVADELKEKGYSDAHQFNNVTVLFTDFVGFTMAGERMTPQDLVDELHVCFRTFDEITSKYRIEKIKTIGDAYLAVAGLPAADPEHAVHVTMAALEILAFMKARMEQMPDKTFDIRIGIHSGSVVAGIVGIKKFAYDIWGDTVNTAARMEQSSEPGRINVSEHTWNLIKDKFNGTYRGKIDAKNKGEMNMYFVDRKKQ